MTNLYTIVPLRAANSRTLVEQSIGRGLRLPYGKRTGVPAGGPPAPSSPTTGFRRSSTRRKRAAPSSARVVIGKDFPIAKQTVVVSRVRRCSASQQPIAGWPAHQAAATAPPNQPRLRPSRFKTPEEVAAAKHAWKRSSRSRAIRSGRRARKALQTARGTEADRREVTRRSNPDSSRCTRRCSRRRPGAREGRRRPRRSRRPTPSTSRESSCCRRAK